MMVLVVTEREKTQASTSTSDSIPCTLRVIRVERFLLGFWKNSNFALIAANVRKALATAEGAM
jgi:hypothetical protein